MFFDNRLCIIKLKKHKEEEYIMTQDTLNAIVEKTKVLIEAPTVCKEAKEAAQKFLESVGSDAMLEQLQAFIKEIKEDIVTIDNLIAFSSSDVGKQHFGEETAAQIAKHALEIKDQGATHCDCPACKAVADILVYENQIN